MTIWTIQQVQAVQGYTFSQTVDMFQVERHAQDGQPNPLLVAVTDHLFKGLAAAVNTWGVDIVLEDCEVKVTPGEYGHMLDVVRIRWRPQTTAGLLVGGPMGGKVLQLDPSLHKVGVRVDEMDRTELFAAAGADTPFEPVPVKQWFYRYAGWSEARRCWAYKAERIDG